MRRSKVRMRRLKKEKESIGKRKNNEYGIKNKSPKIIEYKTKIQHQK